VDYVEKWIDQKLDILAIVRRVSQSGSSGSALCDARRGVSTGSGSDRVSGDNKIELTENLTRSLPLPVLTSSVKLGHRSSRAGRDRLRRGFGTISATPAYYHQDQGPNSYDDADHLRRGKSG
jgi:hypothetical protein